MANPVLGKFLSLIGYFSVRILQYGPFPWKRSNPCIFVLEQSQQIQHLQPRQRKKSVTIVILHIETTSRSLKDWNFSWNFKDEWRRRTFFKCKPPEVYFTIRNRVPYNKLLTNRACSGLTGEYWPSFVFVRTSLHSVRTVTTSGQYSPVRPSRSVSKRLVLCSRGGKDHCWMLLACYSFNKFIALLCAQWSHNKA